MQINSDLVRKLIDDQFPKWSSLPIRPVARTGWDNRTFRLGNDYVTRMPSQEIYAAQVPKEQQWLPFLTPKLSVLIPCVVELGQPGFGYPWQWSVYRWIEGDDIDPNINTDNVTLARQLGNFIQELHSIDASGGPAPGKHNFFRGDVLQMYDDDTQRYAKQLAIEIDSTAALNIWDAAKKTVWCNPPVWVHGDLEASNMLVHQDKLKAVIDFGSCAVGDPACDLVMAWTFFNDKSRAVFRSQLQVDDETWLRARAWALWKALFRMASAQQSQNEEHNNAKKLVEVLISAPQ